MTDAPIPSYRRSARTDVRMWLLLGLGLIFFWIGSTLDPAGNCTGGGNCAPWLVLVAQGMGALFAVGAAFNLVFNPRRGSEIDPVTGDLLWWHGGIGMRSGGAGRIHPSRIGRLCIARRDERTDEVRLFDLDGECLPWFSEEVIAWPYERWAARLATAWPHVEVEILE